MTSYCQDTVTISSYTSSYEIPVSLLCRTLSRVAVKKDLRSEVTANQRSLQKYGMDPGDSFVLFNGIVLQTETTDSFRWAPFRAGIGVLYIE